MRVLLFPLQALVVVVASLILCPAVAVLASLGRQALSYELVRVWCRVFTRVHGVRFTIRGVDLLPREGSYVIVMNHRSHFDGPTLILALPHRFYFVIKRELARIPLWGQAVVNLGYITIDRSQSEKARAQMQAAVSTVSAGRRVLVFPEGTRSRQDTMLPFKKGAFHLAIDAQVPIVPIAVTNSHTVLPKGKLCPRPGTINYVVGKPIPTESLTKQDVPDLLERTRQAIEKLRS